MRKRFSLFLIPIILLSLVIAGLLIQNNITSASKSGAQASQEIAPLELPMVPANYCVSCHAPDDPYLNDPTAWRGGIARNMISPCPASIRLREEIYYTERMMLAIDRGKAALNSSAAATIDTHQAESVDTYSRLLDAPIQSLDAFVAEAQALRYQLGKTQTQINQLMDAEKRQRTLFFSLLVTVILLISLGWGFYNTRKYRAGASRSKRLTYYLMSGLFLLLVFGLFMLPLFREAAQETVMPTAEEQAVATALDTATRTAAAADRADARAWMFSQIGAEWDALDEEMGNQVLETSLQAAAESRENSAALWGEAANALEAVASSPANLEEASLIAAELNSARGRAWDLGLIGAEWTPVDSTNADEIFSNAYRNLLPEQGIYRDLDLRRVAVAWARINPQAAQEAVVQIRDPALRAWGLRDISKITGDKDLLDKALESARQISDPIQRALGISKIAAANRSNELFAEALASLDGQTGPELAYALSELAADSGDARLAAQIDPAYPEARTFALLRIGDYPGAWEIASQIQDPYEQARAQGAIAAGWAEDNGEQATQAVGQIQVPVLRERALRDVIKTTGNASLVENLSLAYYQVQALTGLDQYQSAWGFAEDLKDSYPLVELGAAWAEIDPDSAVQTLEMLEREADKAVVLRELASATGDPDFFQRALGMANAARVRGDALAPAQATLELAREFLSSIPENALAALEQALEITENISIE